MAQQVKYSVKGSYADNGKKVYLTDKLTEKALDSVVVADGKFAFSGSADKDALLGVQAENTKWRSMFFNDGTPVVVNLNDSTLKGSPLNERLSAYDLQMTRPQTAFTKKVAAMSEAEIRAHSDEVTN
jgi:hypothetical protein